MPHVAATTWLWAIPLLIVAGYLFLRSPRWAVAGILAGTILGVYQSSIGIGEISLRIVDVPYGALVAWVLLIRRRRGAPDRPNIGQRQIAVLLAAFGISLVPVAVTSSDEVFALGVSLARFVQTMSLIWLLPYVLDTDRARRFVLRAVVYLSAFEVGSALYEAARNGALNARLVGGNGPNGTGLISAILLVFALHSPIPERKIARVVFGVVGFVGLVKCQSIAAISATGLVLGIHGLYSAATNENVRRSALLKPARIILLAVGVVGLVSTLRPVNLPSSPGFDESSTTHRLILGTAGLEIFVDHPLVGAGWLRSGNAEVIGTRDLSTRLHRRFTDARDVFFPDVNPGGVHNAYIQIAAEAGVVGIAAFAAAFISCRRRLRRLLSRLEGDDARQARCAYLIVLVILIWWNDNSLFGAQPETVLMATMLGVLASFRLGAAEISRGEVAEGVPISSSRQLLSRPL